MCDVYMTQLHNSISIKYLNQTIHTTLHTNRSCLAKNRLSEIGETTSKVLGKLFELLVMQLHDTMALCMVMVEGRAVNSKSICRR
jgi:hypothetical protein